MVIKTQASVALRVLHTNSFLFFFGEKCLVHDHYSAGASKLVVELLPVDAQPQQITQTLEALPSLILILWRVSFTRHDFL